MRPLSVPRESAWTLREIREEAAREVVEVAELEVHFGSYSPYMRK